MSLAQRNRVASVGRRRHYADDSGHFDGGPYGEDNQGEQEEVFISQTPGTEAVAVPTPGDGTISNSPNNLVAGLQRRIMQRNAEQKRDLIAYEQITGRRIRAGNEPVQGTEIPQTVNPTVQDPAGEQLTGDNFESTALPTTTASVRAFAAFDNWLAQTTGRTARQHGDPAFLRQAAARFCQASGMRVESMFPALGVVLREARNRRGGTMRRQADESMSVAAPQDRIDVEKPVANTTSADAQASQFNLSDFANNAGDSLADPEGSPDSQIWAPGEGEAARKESRKADGLTAVRYAEAYIRAGLAPDTPESKWKVAGLAQTMRHGTIVDRIRLLDAVNQANSSGQRRRTAGVSRGTGRPLPRNLGQRQRTASAGDDLSMDAALFFKG